MKVRVGDNLNLFRQTPDGDTSRVVKAILRDSDGDLLPDSPVTLTHLGDGQYFDNSVSMPSIDAVLASIQIFEMDGTTPTADPITEVLFEREFISALGKEIVGVINSGLEAIDAAKLTISRGSDILIPFKFLVKELGDPFTLADADRIAFQFKKQDGTNLEVSTDSALGVKQVSQIDTIADVSGSLDGKYFILYDQNGSVAFWYDVGDSGTLEPSHGADRSVEITTVAANDDADTVASKTQAVIDADSEFSATVSSNEITVTDDKTGIREDVDDGTSGFTVVTVTPGEDTIVAQASITPGNLGKASAQLDEEDTNSLRLGFDQDIKVIIDKATERTVVQLRNVLRVVD